MCNDYTGEDMLKEVPDIPGYYADDNGNIYSARLYTKQKKLVKRIPYESCGYYRLGIHLNGKRIDLSVAYLVARAFVPGYKEGLEVNHINKNRKDNRPSNLEWLTRKENVRFSIAKKVKVIDLNTNTIKIWDTCTDFCNSLGISTSNFARFYMRKKQGYMKKWNLQCFYI